VVAKIEQNVDDDASQNTMGSTGSTMTVVAAKKTNPSTGTTTAGGGDNDKALCSIVRAFCKLVEGVYAKMVRPIVTNCKLDDMRKGKESTGDGEYKFGMGENGTIVAGKGGSKKKKHPASRGGTTPCKSNNNGKVADGTTKKQGVGHHPNNCASQGGIDSGGKENGYHDNDDDQHHCRHPQILSLLSCTRSLCHPDPSTAQMSPCSMPCCVCH
jgi:hypothetical protein